MLLVLTSQVGHSFLVGSLGSGLGLDLSSLLFFLGDLLGVKFVGQLLLVDDGTEAEHDCDDENGNGEHYEVVLRAAKWVGKTKF